MTISRSKLLFCVVALALISVGRPAYARQAGEADCGNIDPGVERACVDTRIAAKEKRLAGVYQQAMISLGRNNKRFGKEDNRADPAHLERAQAAWKRFVAEDCIVQAAFGGGSNASVSDRERECYESALDERMALLRQLADGSFGGD